jgi:hypothetical protein
MRFGRRHFLAWVLVPLLVGLGLPTSAAAWTAPFDLSDAGQNADVPQVAIDDAGDAVFVWQRSDGTNMRIQARERPAAGTPSPVVDLSPTGQDARFPQVDVDNTGDAVFVWERFDGTNWRIQAGARSATGLLTAVQTISRSGQDARNPQVAVDPDGDAVITWQRFDGTNRRIQAVARSATGALSAVQDISKGGRDAFEPQVAVDVDNDAAITWRRSDGTNWRIQARMRWNKGVLDPVLNLSNPGEDAYAPQVGMANIPDAVFVWQRFDGLRWRILARGLSATGVLAPVQALSGSGLNSFDPQVAVNATGDAVFAWRHFNGTHWQIQARTRRHEYDRTLSAVQNLSDSRQDAFSPQVGMDDAGDAVITWRRFDRTNWRIQARERSAGSALSPEQNLSTPGQDADLPQVVVDPNGDAVVTWERPDGLNTRIQASAGP